MRKLLFLPCLFLVACSQPTIKHNPGETASLPPAENPATGTRFKIWETRWSGCLLPQQRAFCYAGELPGESSTSERLWATVQAIDRDDRPAPEIWLRIVFWIGVWWRILRPTLLHCHVEEGPGVELLKLRHILFWNLAIPLTTIAYWIYLNEPVSTKVGMFPGSICYLLPSFLSVWLYNMVPKDRIFII